MKIVTTTDCRGNKFKAYEARTKDGKIVLVDKDLADLYWDGYEEFVRREVKKVEGNTP